MTFTFEDAVSNGANIKVFGVGGAGCNAVNTMIAARLSSVDFIVANTDRQALENSAAPRKVQIGEAETKGLGAGANPEVGRAAAEQDIETIKQYLDSPDMVFIAAGMGGGTGTGAAPVIAAAARAMGALTVGVVTRPFTFEGRRRAAVAEGGIEELSKHVDSLIIIPNQKLFAITEKQTTLVDGFRMADEVLLHAIKSISDLINVPGMINLDFADVKTVMSDMGRAFMGIGEANGENRAAEAARRAITNPLLEDVSICGARGMLINICGSSSMTFQDLEAATAFIQEHTHPEANIIYGQAIDESMGEKIQITVIATGFQDTGSEDDAEPLATKRETAAPQITAVRDPEPATPPPARAKVVKIGTIISDFADDGDYDIPTFVRNQQSIM